MIIICDLDGTLANIKHRLHYVKDLPEGCRPDWDAFNEACDKDEPYEDIVLLLDALAARGAHIIVVSGRSDKVRAKTANWLAIHDIPYNRLYMRRAGDFRSDVDIKREIYIDFILPFFEEHPAETMLVLDDRDKVVELWRSLGLRCLQVQKGDY